MKERLHFQELEDLVEQHGGTMRFDAFEKKGDWWGVWIIRVGEARRAFGADGFGFPELDALHVPKPGVTNPSQSSDYSFDLVDGAWDRLLRLLSEG